MSPQRSLTKRLGYSALRIFCRLVGVTCFGFRCFGRSRMPVTGAVLVCANHQSFFDPVLVGMTFDRRLNYLARKTLFDTPFLRGLIEFLDAIPLDREGLGMQGLKECLRRLRQGEVVLIFPEGTRTRTGSLGPLQPGFTMLARRGEVSILPVGIDGAFQAWPRHARFPRPSRIRVCVGPALSPDVIARYDDAQLLAEVERRMRSCLLAARQSREGLPVARETRDQIESSENDPGA